MEEQEELEMEIQQAFDTCNELAKAGDKHSAEAWYDEVKRLKEKAKEFNS